MPESTLKKVREGGSNYPANNATVRVVSVMKLAFGCSARGRIPVNARYRFYVMLSQAGGQASLEACNPEKISVPGWTSSTGAICRLTEWHYSGAGSPAERRILPCNMLL
jgi:hypothetical protein